MEPSAACYDLIKRCEECRLTAYLDPIGIPTIGWGHTGASVRIGDTCTQQQADVWLAADAAKAAKLISLWVLPALTQGQFDALTSFTFNIGPGLVDHKDGFVWLKSRDKTGAPRHSTLLNLLNESNYTLAADEFPKWNKAGGKVLLGLTKRREAEAALFRGGKA